MMQIVVTNAHSIRNSGDAVLLQVTLQEIERCFPNATVTVALNDPHGYTPTHGETAVASFVHWFKSNEGARGSWKTGNLLLSPVLLGWAILAALGHRLSGRSIGSPFHPEQDRLLRAYFAADLIISCPGNFFLSGSGLGLPFLLTLFSFAYGWLAGKPLYMMQQTIGPFRRAWQGAIMRWVLERVRIVAVRDDKSRQTLDEIGLRHPHCHVLPDAAFLFQGTGDAGALAAEIAQMAQAAALRGADGDRLRRAE
ncbi:MAG: polysaccharide pyruvyl transferase family protein [Caldilineaceae bacterium]